MRCAGAARMWSLKATVFEEAAARAQRLVHEKGLTYVHPFDDPDVIAGQGTVGMEIVRQHQEPLDAVFVPVGGGGLLAGVAAYVRYVWPKTRIIGVEPEDAACLKAGAGTRATRDAAGGRIVRRRVCRRAGGQGNLSGDPRYGG